MILPFFLSVPFVLSLPCLRSALPLPFPLRVSFLIHPSSLTPSFSHSDLSPFISSRLHARIDKVHGIVETTGPSLKSVQSEVVVGGGDALLNEVQRLSRICIRWEGRGYRKAMDGNDDASGLLRGRKNDVLYL